jgi:hypothetical protein
MSLVSQIAAAIIVTAFFVALTTVALFYCYKWGAGAIKKRSHYIKRLKKSKAFDSYNSGNVEVLKKHTKTAKGGRD